MTPSREDFIRRIVVVDDESIIRFLLADLLSQMGAECHTASNALEAIQLVRKVDPDVAIVDLDLGAGASGAELITAVRLHNPAIGIVLLSNFLPKKAEQLALERVTYLHKSEVQSSRALEDAVFDSVKLAQERIVRPIDQVTEAVQSLTKNQQETLGLVAKGKTNQEIAEEFGIGTKAVEHTVSRIYRKLGLDSFPLGGRRVEAARVFMRTLGSARSER
jgi:DNA-binding NarL/FixJ family response regulator